MFHILQLLFFLFVSTATSMALGIDVDRPPTPTSTPVGGNTAPGTRCGTLTGGQALDEMLVNTNCVNVAEGLAWYWVTNNVCGMCMLFSQRDCGGGMTWSGGPLLNIDFGIKPSRSYYCI